MIVIAKNFKTYVSLGTIMFLRRRSLSCFREQFFPLGIVMFSKRKSFFSFKNMVAPWGNLSLAILGTWLFPQEQLRPLFISGICFHPIPLWMKI
jgi:hypothetical protein